MSHSRAEHDVRGAGDGDAGYEIKDANTRAIASFALGLAVFVAVVLFGLLRLYDRMLKDKATPEPVSSKEQLGKQALIHQREQLLHLRESEAEVLGRYGWVDRKAGVVRVPIDRAINLVVERGVPAGKGAKSDVEINSHAGTPAPPAEPGPLDRQSQPSGTKK